MKTNSFIINSPGPLNASLISSTTTSSYAGCDASAHVEGYGGTPPYSYFWFPGGYTTNIVNTLCQATYNIYVTDSLGAKDTVTFSISGPANPCGIPPSSVVTVTDASSSAACDGGAC